MSRRDDPFELLRATNPVDPAALTPRAAPPAGRGPAPAAGVAASDEGDRAVPAWRHVAAVLVMLVVIALGAVAVLGRTTRTTPADRPVGPAPTAPSDAATTPAGDTGRLVGQALTDDGTGWADPIRLSLRFPSSDELIGTYVAILTGDGVRSLPPEPEEIVSPGGSVPAGLARPTIVFDELIEIGDRRFAHAWDAADRSGTAGWYEVRARWATVPLPWAGVLEPPVLEGRDRLRRAGTADGWQRWVGNVAAPGIRDLATAAGLPPPAAGLPSRTTDEREVEVHVDDDGRIRRVLVPLSDEPSTIAAALRLDPQPSARPVTAPDGDLPAIVDHTGLAYDVCPDATAAQIDAAADVLRADLSIVEVEVLSARDAGSSDRADATDGTGVHGTLWAWVRPGAETDRLFDLHTGPAVCEVALLPGAAIAD